MTLSVGRNFHPGLPRVLRGMLPCGVRTFLSPPTSRQPKNGRPPSRKSLYHVLLPCNSGGVNVFRIKQKLVSQPLENIEAEVHRQLDALGRKPPCGRVAVTAGSRGIDNIAGITKAAGDWLRANGADPFLVPCMGSHNGATAEGQQQMIESLGLTDKIFAVVVPTERTVKIKGGRRVEEEEKVFPGYVLVDMIVDDQSWFVVRNTPRVTGFVGSGVNPVPLKQSEVDELMGRMQATEGTV